LRNSAKDLVRGRCSGSDAVMLDLTMPLHATEDVARGFLNTAEAFDKEIESPPMIFHGR
jgi:hypothetical protein